MPEVRIARLFDAVDPESGPYFAADRGRVEDAAERERIAGFLDAGTVILFTTAREPDRVDPASGGEVGMSLRTDGEWVWSDALAYYVRRHGIAPDPDFYAHIAGLDYTCPPTDDATAQRALEAVYAR